MFRWAWRMHLIEHLPRNIDDIARIPNGNNCQRKVRTFTVDELRTLWTTATRRTRCYMALAVNCSMGQQDIADLRMGEVHREHGYIERARGKTGVWAKHKVWGVTLDLLEEHSQPGAGLGDRVFLGRNGRPLVRRWLEDGRQRHTDAIKNAFDRLLKKVGLCGTGRGFYSLRKTGATLIEQIDPLSTEMYLSHVEPGMKAVYAQRDWKRLERALAKMEERLESVLRTGQDLKESKG